MGTRIPEAPSNTNAFEFLVRGYPLDNKHHFYSKAELASPSFEYLVPLCQVDELYPDRHPRVEVKSGYIAIGGFCLGCATSYQRAEDAIGVKP